MTLAKTRTRRWQQCHALHCHPNSDNRAKEDNNNSPAGSIGCGDHFGGVVALMGSGAKTTTTTTKINDDARPPQVPLEYDNDHNDDGVVVIIAAGGR
jgi:hypothetical protein